MVKQQLRRKQNLDQIGGPPGAKRGRQELGAHDEVTEVVGIAKRPKVTIVLDD